MCPLITNTCFLSARKRQKQEHVDHELGSVQSSDPEGREGDWEVGRESVFQKA